MQFSSKEEILFLTSNWTGERLPDGRPNVSADLLVRLRKLTLEEAWGHIYRLGYKYQFQGEFMRTNPDDDYRLVGRAVTATMMPTRPDLQALLMKQGLEAEGRKGTFNQWVIESLIEDDVLVVDFFDKVRDGTFVGGNLSTAIRTRTKRGGAVLWGGIRDMEQIVKIEGLQVLHRGEDPTPIAEYVMTGFNTATRIGGAVCIPGDIVYASKSGVLFIPAHLLEDVVIGAEKSHVRDIFGFYCLQNKIYTSAQIDTGWTVPMMEHFIKWIAETESAVPFRHLVWDEELQRAAEDDKRRAETGPSVVV
ncbi:MAG: RraA family protein [Oscillospiraceae bacterium]|nr:RraA family protein [Oscillospiraceae bacterium]